MRAVAGAVLYKILLCRYTDCRYNIILKNKCRRGRVHSCFSVLEEITKVVTGDIIKPRVIYYIIITFMTSHMQMNNNTSVYQ